MKFDDVNRLRTLIRQRAQELANGVSFRGAMFAMRSGAQHLAPSAKYEEKFAGQPHEVHVQRCPARVLAAVIFGVGILIFLEFWNFSFTKTPFFI